MPQENITTQLSDQFHFAVAYAQRVHAKQVRKGTTAPYLSHLLGVCSIVLQYGGDEATAIASLLHDAPEDQGGLERLADIRQVFGSDVAAMVEACSDSLAAKGEKKAPWKDRKTAFVLAAKQESDPRVSLIEAADKLHNARNIIADYNAEGPTVFDKFVASPQDTSWYYQEMKDALYSKDIPTGLVYELENAANDLAEIVDFLDRV